MLLMSGTILNFGLARLPQSVILADPEVQHWATTSAGTAGVNSPRLSHTVDRFFSEGDNSNVYC